MPITSTEKRWDWVKKGCPVVCEVGPRDVAGGSLAVIRRDAEDLKGRIMPKDEFAAGAAALLADIQASLFNQAKAMRESAAAQREQIPQILVSPMSQVN